MEHTEYRFIEIGHQVAVTKRDWLFGLTDAQWFGIVIVLVVALGMVIQARMMPV